jgi:GTP-binding protein Era
LGPPNAGKSTLLNQVLKSKLAITSAKPQTTRNRIVGIHTDESIQAVFLDTPGVHEAWTELNKVMVARSAAAISEADVVCWLGDMTAMAKRLDAGRPPLDGNDLRVAALLANARCPIVFVANKVDVVPRELVLPVIAAVNEQLTPVASVPTSALTGDGVPELLEVLRQQLPEGPLLYPEDEWAQVTERFLVAEIVREKIFHLTEQEVPYATFVDVVRFDEAERESRGLVRIYADVVVERGSQKGIVIGKRGEMLKRIGTLARKELQDILQCRVYLELFVKVEKDWTRTERGLRRVGFDA